MKKAERSKSDPRRFLPHEDYQDMVWMEGDVVKAASTSRRSAIPPAPVCRWRAVHPQSYLTSPLPSPLSVIQVNTTLGRWSANYEVRRTFLSPTQ